MTPLCHRGLWTAKDEQNTLQAFRLAWQEGWGIETDLRDHAGEVVVSHDPARGNELRLEALLEAHAAYGANTPLALNVKADGLAPAVAAALAVARTTSAFAFDMSVPDTFGYLRAGVPVWTRWSDVEPHPPLLERSVGIWVDAFEDDGWWDVDAVAKAAVERTVCVVSPELHGRDPRATWAQLASLPVLVCTDRPHDLLETA